MARTTMASLQAQIAALQAQIASNPAKPVKASTFRSRADIVAGKGWPCSAAKPCGRSDLRTPTRAAIHGIDAGGHAPKA